MTIEADTTARAEWERLFTRYEAQRILFEADDAWGPLAEWTARADYRWNAIRTSTPEEREALEAERSEAEGRHGRELRRHMETIYDPLIEAALALVRAPAPDLPAVRLKRNIIDADGVRLVDFEDEEGELFGIICRDIERLTGFAV